MSLIDVALVVKMDRKTAKRIEKKYRSSLVAELDSEAGVYQGRPSDTKEVQEETVPDPNERETAVSRVA